MRALLSSNDAVAARAAAPAPPPRRARPRRRRVWSAASLLGLAACHPDPAYTLPDGAPAPIAVREVASSPGATIELGSVATDACVLRSVQRTAADTDGGQPDPSLTDVPDVKLYVDGSGTWKLATYGPMAATAACVPWSAFGGPRPVTRFDNGALPGQGGDGAAAIAPTGGRTACVLSDIEGDFGAPGNGARLEDAALIVTDADGGEVYASATCFDGDGATAGLPFTDYPVDASGGTDRITVTADDAALCGIGRLSGMTGGDSSLVLSDGVALATHAVATVRCLAYASPQAH